MEAELEEEDKGNQEDIVIDKQQEIVVKSPQTI